MSIRTMTVDFRASHPDARPVCHEDIVAVRFFTTTGVHVASATFFDGVLHLSTDNEMSIVPMARNSIAISVRP